MPRLFSVEAALCYPDGTWDCDTITIELNLAEDEEPTDGALIDLFAEMHRDLNPETEVVAYGMYHWYEMEEEEEDG